MQVLFNYDMRMEETVSRLPPPDVSSHDEGQVLRALTLLDSSRHKEMQSLKK